MFLPRTESEDCPVWHVSCTRSMVGNSDNAPGNTKSVDTTSDMSYLSRPGPRRYIGIGMVVAMAFVVLVLWMYYAQYPRRHLTWIYGSRLDHDSSLVNEGGTAESSEKDGERVGHDADIKVVDSSADGSGSKPTQKSKRPRTTRSQREQARNRMLQSEPRGVIKEVSGGLVVFTEVPRPVRTRDRCPQPPVDWEFEHVHGVRFEVSFFFFWICARFCHLSFDGDGSNSARMKWMLINGYSWRRLGHRIAIWKRSHPRDRAVSRTKHSLNREVWSVIQGWRECQHFSPS